MIRKMTISLLLLTTVSACSNKAIYTNIQNNQRSHCLGLPDSERGPRFASVEMSYPEYERQRQALKKQNELNK